MFELVLSIINSILIVILIALLIYIYVRVIGFEKNTNNSISEIKSKIGSMIRDINNINRMEYNIDMEQESRLNNLVYSKPN